MAKTMTFNGKTFVNIKAKEVGACHGFYSRKKNGVSLFKPTRDLEAFIVDNDKQGHFVVTAGNRSGKPFYMFSTCTLTEKWLGIEGMGMQQTRDCIKAIKYAD
jgi:hypothetical protein